MTPDPRGRRFRGHGRFRRLDGGFPFTVVEEEA